MENTKNAQIVNSLSPFRQPRIFYFFSWIVAILMTGTSILGIAFHSILYPTDTLYQSFVPTDIVNLVLGLPALIVSMWLSHRGQIIGWICWIGALFYVAYTYIAYLIAIPFHYLFLPYLLLISFSVYTLLGMVMNTDGQVLHNHLIDRVPAKISGGILFGLAVFILFRQSGLIVSAYFETQAIDQTEIALWIADLTLACPSLFIAGILLWKKKPLGYILGGGLLFVYALLSIAAIIVLGIQPYISTVTVDWIGIIVLCLMAMACLVPFSYFVRGVKGND